MRRSIARYNPAAGRYILRGRPQTATFNSVKGYCCNVAPDTTKKLFNDHQ